MHRKTLISLILVTVLIGAGLSIAKYLIDTKPTPPSADTTRPPLLVSAAKVDRQSFVEPILGYGTATADRRTRVAAQVAGEVAEVSPRLEIGAKVDEGEVLARIDPRDFAQNVRRVEAAIAALEAQQAQLDVQEQNLGELIDISQRELEIAEREYQRVLNLLEKGQAGRREADLARMTVEQSRRTLQQSQSELALLPARRDELAALRGQRAAELELARLDLERCTIRAPFAGQVETVSVEIGERVRDGLELFTLVDPRRIEIPIELPISLRDRVEVGAACDLMLESEPGSGWRGAVARISPTANEMTRTFSLLVEVDNERQRTPLMPGMFVQATIAGPLLTDVIVVPRSAIQDGRVFIVRDDRASPRPIRIERRLRENAVVSGLEAGQVVILSNLDALAEGAPVAVDELVQVTPMQVELDTARGDGRRRDGEQDRTN